MESNIKNIRKEKKIKQKDLAKKSGLAIGTIVKAENHIENCKMSTLEKIADTLNVDILDLFFKGNK